MERVWRNIIIGIGTVVFIGVIAYQWAVVAPKRRMDRFLAELSRIEMGSTKFEDWRQRLNDAHIRSASISCNAGDCTIMENAKFQLLHKVRLAPLSGMQATVTFKGGIASEAQVLLEVDDRETAGVMQPGTGVTIAWSLESKRCPQHYCSYVKDRWGYDWGVVEMDSGVSSEQRTKAFAIDTDCLTKIGGCKRVDAILPRVFGKWRWSFRVI